MLLRSNLYQKKKNGGIRCRDINVLLNIFKARIANTNFNTGKVKDENACKDQEKYENPRVIQTKIRK